MHLIVGNKIVFLRLNKEYSDWLKAIQYLKNIFF